MLLAEFFEKLAALVLPPYLKQCRIYQQRCDRVAAKKPSLIDPVSSVRSQCMENTNETESSEHFQSQFRFSS